MEYNQLEEELWESLQEPYKHSDYGPLFEENDEEKKPTLEDRVDTLEYRLERALRCFNQCQSELSEIRKGFRDLTQEQTSCRKRQERHGSVMKVGLYAVAVILLLTQVKVAAELGWKLFDRLAQLFHAAPESVSGVLASAVILCLAVKLGRVVARAISKRRKGRDENAVCDR